MRVIDTKVVNLDDLTLELKLRDGVTVRAEFFADSAKALHALEGQPAH